MFKSIEMESNISRLERLFREGWIRKAALLTLVDDVAHEMHRQHYGEGCKPVSLDKR